MQETPIGVIADPLQSLKVSIDTLTLDPANARKHGTKNLDAIKASLHAFGQRKPIVVQRKGMIVRAGNGTLEAAKALGWSHLAAVIIDEDNATASQFAIADNRTAELAEWDDETLASLLDVMEPADREALAFDDSDLETLLNGLGEFDVDEVGMPELKGGDRDPIQQMTFTLHDDQVALIVEAMNRAKKSGPFGETGNSNDNGNALARMAEAYRG